MATTVLVLPPERRRELAGLLRRAGRREIGGVMMGEQIAPGRFRIVELSVDETSGGTSHFVRNADHHRVALAAFFARTGADYRRFNYLGEWHSHPSFPVRPSGEDVRSMEELVRGERDIAFASLMIVRLRYLVRLQCAALMFTQAGPPLPIRITRATTSETMQHDFGALVVP